MDILLSNVYKEYGNVVALNNINAHFKNGRLTALLGPSGCGKTTLLNILSGIISQSSGTIAFNGKNASRADISSIIIGYVFQNYSLYPSMTVCDNIKFPLTNIKYPDMSRKQRKQLHDAKVSEIAHVLQIDGLLDRYPAELSGGQQQRVAIGRALVRNPDLLLMDEPFANLDKKLAVELRDEIRVIQQNMGVTTVFVTHNQADANAISDYIILMNNGVIQQYGTPSELYDNPQNLFVADFLSEHSINIIKRAEINLFPYFLDYFNDEKTASIAFRPEYVSLVPTGNDEHAFTAVSNTRSAYYWIVVLLNSKTKIHMLSQTPVNNDDKYSIYVEPYNVLRFDSTGSRII